MPFQHNLGHHSHTNTEIYATLWNNIPLWSDYINTHDLSVHKWHLKRTGHYTS